MDLLPKCIPSEHFCNCKQLPSHCYLRAISPKYMPSLCYLFWFSINQNCSKLTSKYKITSPTFTRRKVWLDVNFVFKPLNIFLNRGHSLWMSAHFQWFLTLSPFHSCPHLAHSSVLVDTNFEYLKIFIPSTPPPYTSTKRVSRKVKYLLAALIQDKNRERINM